MKFAHFAHVWGKPGMTPHQRYEQLWRELKLCDELGFDFGFCVEHHFRPDESWMSAPSLYCVAAAARTRNIRVGAMGYIVPLYEPIRLAEEIAIADQMTGGRLEVGLVSGIDPAYFKPFGIPYEKRKEPTLEYVDFLNAAYGEQQPFTFKGECFHVEDTLLAVQPAQRPRPSLWMQSRDPETLELCAREGMNTGYFFVVPRADAAPVYRKFIDDWKAKGWKRKPDIAYSTLVYVDETDEKAREVAMDRARRAYLGFLPPPRPGETFEEQVEAYSRRFIARGEAGAAGIMKHLFEPEWLLENNLVLFGSPDTVARNLRKMAEEGLFNSFFGEFNFADMPEEDLMRSIRLFGEEVIPRLRDFDPY